MKSLCLLLGLLLWPHFASANPTEFATWLAGIRQEALQRGISPGTIAQSLDGLAPLEWVIAQDRKQMARPGGKKVTGAFSRYLKRVLPQEKIDRARERYQLYSPLLRQIEQQYGVPGHYLVALWGIESHFGQSQGKTPVIQALATLAYDGRRGDFFREELFQALRILDQGHIAQDGMIGSWAGAMGQVQFMPSSFAAYAVDFDGDGRKDIWNNEADALASAARYLIDSGWRPGEGWGEKVTLPKGFNQRLVGLETRKTLGEWRRLGIRDIDGPPQWKASLILPDGTRNPAFLVFDNFRVLLTWNRSNSFALTVGHLAHRLYGEGQKKIVGKTRS